MTTQPTSRESYRLLVESGALKGKQAKALDAVMRHGPATSGEIIQTLGPNVNLWRARFTELQGKGMIVEVGQRRCTITGRTAIVWQYSGRTKPLELQHRVGRKALIGMLARACKLLENGANVNPQAVDAFRADAKAAGARL